GDHPPRHRTRTSRVWCVVRRCRCIPAILQVENGVCDRTASLRNPSLRTREFRCRHGAGRCVRPRPQAPLWCRRVERRMDRTLGGKAGPVGQGDVRATLQPTLSMAPSDYINRNIRVTPFHFEDVAMYFTRYPHLSDVFSYSTDYPHFEGGKES